MFQPRPHKTSYHLSMSDQEKIQKALFTVKESIEAAKVLLAKVRDLEVSKFDDSDSPVMKRLKQQEKALKAILVNDPVTQEDKQLVLSLKLLASMTAIQEYNNLKTELRLTFKS